MIKCDLYIFCGYTAVVGLAESGCGIAAGWSAMEIMANSVHDALDDA